jgi:hypothetical protein
MEILYWLINTQTLGGLFVLAVFGFVLTLYVVMVRWILAGAQVSHDSHPSTGE